MSKLESLTSAFSGSAAAVIYCNPSIIEEIKTEIANLQGLKADGNYPPVDEDAVIDNRFKNAFAVRYNGVSFFFMPINDILLRK